MPNNGEFSAYRFRSNRPTEDRVGTGVLSGQTATMDREKLSNQKRSDDIFLSTVPTGLAHAHIQRITKNTHTHKNNNKLNI
jgi:hypothetical protein